MRSELGRFFRQAFEDLGIWQTLGAIFLLLLALLLVALGFQFIGKTIESGFRRIKDRGDIRKGYGTYIDVLKSSILAVLIDDRRRQLDLGLKMTDTNDQDDLQTRAKDAISRTFGPAYAETIESLVYFEFSFYFDLLTKYGSSAVASAKHMSATAKVAKYAPDNGKDKLILTACCALQLNREPGSNVVELDGVLEIAEALYGDKDIARARLHGEGRLFERACGIVSEAQQGADETVTAKLTS